jgi:hypothetical protein
MSSLKVMLINVKIRRTDETTDYLRRIILFLAGTVN